MVRTHRTKGGEGDTVAGDFHGFQEGLTSTTVVLCPTGKGTFGVGGPRRGTVGGDRLYGQASVPIYSTVVRSVVRS